MVPFGFVLRANRRPRAARATGSVKLTWQGLIEMKQDRMMRLLVVARGSEKLRWANQTQKLKGLADVTLLPGGHAIDMSCGVRYGILGEPVPAEAAVEPAEAGDVQEPGQFPDEARKQLIDVLGGPFVVFRDKVQDELKLSDEQRQKLLEKFPPYVHETMKMFDRVKDLGPEEREREMQEHHRKSHEKLSAFLKRVLDARQQGRLFQLQLQQGGVFALLGSNEAFLKLKITEEQRRQFTEVVQQMHKKMEATARQAANTGNPEEVRRSMRKLRQDHAAKIEALLSESQKKLWKELLSTALAMDD